MADNANARISFLDYRVGQLETIEKAGHYLPFLTVAGGEPYAGATTVYRAVVAKGVVLRRLSVAVYVAAPNTGANYWTINLMAAIAGTIASVDTSGVTAATWTRLATTTFTPSVIDTSEVYLEIQIAPTGAPGAIRLAGACYVV